MQQAVRDALIAFMAATSPRPGSSHQGRSAGRNRACQGGCLPLQKPSYACAVREDMLNFDG
jgi:hypothetical protein